MTQRRPTMKRLEEEISNEKQPPNNNIRTLSKESSGYTPQAKRSTKNKASPQISQQSSKSPPQQSNNLMRYFMANKKAEVNKSNSFYAKNCNPAPVAQRTLSFNANQNEEKMITASSRTTSNSNNIARNLIADPLYSTEASVELSRQQRHILDRCINTDNEDGSSNNIFYTGGGGTGKSLLLKQIISKCVEKYGASSVFVTATTGLAACAIGGSTIHQFLGIPAIDEEESASEWESLFNQVISCRLIINFLSIKFCLTS